MEEQIDTPETVLESIRTGQYDKQLRDILRVGRERLERIGFNTIMALQIGSRVKIIAPNKQYNHQVGTVRKIKLKKVVVDFDQLLIGTNFQKNVNCPVSILEAI